MFSRQRKYTKLIVIGICAGILGLFLSLAEILPAGSNAPQLLGVILEPDHTHQTSAGQTVVYDHILTNTGTETDTFLLEVMSLQGWLTELGSEDYPNGTALLPIRVGSQMTASLWVSVTVPSDAACVREVTIITATSQISSTVRDTVIDTTIVSCKIYLPLVLKRWPPIPYPPTLYSVSNSQGNSSYLVSWSEQPEQLADTYILEEATDTAFTENLRVACTTSQQSCTITSRLAGTYYYRVRGLNSWGYGSWSNAQSTTVLLPDIPILSPISNADGDGNYTVAWNATARATSYRLQEDTTPIFSNPIVVYIGSQTSWSITDKTSTTYYYRVQATGPSGQSGWSNIESVVVLPPPPIEIVRHSGATYYLHFSEDVYGTKHVRGISEIRNNSDCIRELVEVRMDVISNLTVQVESFTEIWNLRPGQTSPVVFVSNLPFSFNPDNAYANVTIISEGYCTSEDSQSGLSITSYAFEPIAPGSFQVYGKVSNSTGVTQSILVIGWARYSLEHPGLITGVNSDWVYGVPNAGREDYGPLYFSGPPGGPLDYTVVAQH